MPKKIAVIGAGIIGLTAAIRLLEKGFAVTIFARDIKTNMASRAAPGLWIPYRAAPENCIIKWATRSLDVYENFTAVQGVVPMPLLELYNIDRGMPLWTKILKNYRELEASELPADYARGFTTNTFRIDTSIHVDYLLNHFQKLGGNIVEKEFKKIAEVDAAFNIIINCSGVWSAELVPDKNSFPIRGQYLLAKKPAKLAKITFATLDEENYILIVPRTHDCYIGGTTNYYDWETTVNPDITDLQIQRAQALEPLLKNIHVISTGVGLRPGRKAVRLEMEKLADKRTVIHNYGHGGSGFTVAWGCADDVVSLVLAEAIGYQ